MLAEARSRDEQGVDANRRCPFCREIAGGQVERELGAAAVLRDNFPVADGHRLVVPRRHVSDLFELSSEEAADVWSLLRRVQQEVAASDPSVSGFNVGVNVGASAGQTVPHVHVHLIPRRDGDTESPRGGVRGVIPSRMSY